MESGVKGWPLDFSAWAPALRQRSARGMSAVQMRFDARTGSDRDGELRARLMKLAGSRLTLDGVILITAVRYRTQERNRADAIERLQGLVDKASIAPVYRVPTRPTRASKERRLEGKAKRSTIKSGRGRPGSDD